MSPPDFNLHRIPFSAGEIEGISRILLRKGRIYLLGLLALGIPMAAPAEIKTGDFFPSLNSANLLGGNIPATTGRIALVDFWASWCAPCKESFPTYAQLQTDYASRGLVIVAVSVDQNPKAFDAFLKKMAPSFPTLRDKDQQLVREVKVPVMPTCYILGPDGRVRFIHQGFHGAVTERDIRHEIDALLVEGSSTP